MNNKDIFLLRWYRKWATKYAVALSAPQKEK